MEEVGKDTYCNGFRAHMSYSSPYAPLHDLEWHILVELTASVNMILVNIRMLGQCINMEARHREQRMSREGFTFWTKIRTLDSAL